MLTTLSRMRHEKANRPIVLDDDEMEGCGGCSETCSESCGGSCSGTCEVTESHKML